MEQQRVQQTSPELEVRNLRFVFDHTVPKHWHAASAVRTAVFSSQSLFFPAGERFFVDSVKHYIPRLSDPHLRQQAQRFCGQEAVHQREHTAYNRMLEQQGYPAERMQRAVERLLAFVTRTTLPRWRLAVTCALEHFTAVDANYTLTDPRVLAGAEPRMAAFWRWHAGEELEHRAVPYDIYYARGGHYLERICVMLATTFLFQAYSWLHLLRFMRIDGCLFSLRAWRDLLGYLAPRALSGEIWRKRLAYYRPGFHPSRLDSTAALAVFARELRTSLARAE